MKKVNETGPHQYITCTDRNSNFLANGSIGNSKGTFEVFFKSSLIQKPQPFGTLNFPLLFRSLLLRSEGADEAPDLGLS